MCHVALPGAPPPPTVTKPKWTPSYTSQFVSSRHLFPVCATGRFVFVGRRALSSEIPSQSPLAATAVGMSSDVISIHPANSAPKSTRNVPAPRTSTEPLPPPRTRLSRPTKLLGVSESTPAGGTVYS